MILEVRIKAPPGGSNRTLKFTKSPIRIGRNQLNDISLEDPFVSEWHGTIRYDDRSVAYFDLGSTNGTQLDGKRLTKNVPIDLSPTSALKIGLLELTISRIAEPEPAPTPPPRSAAEAGAPPRAPSGAHHTLAWGRADRPVAPGATSDTSKTGRQPPPAAAQAPAGAPRPVSGPVPSTANTGSSPGGSAALKAPESNVALRQEKLLEAFTESFIGLRKGYEQFGREVGVRTINGATPLHRAGSRRELLDYFAQPNLDVAATARDLIAIFADFGIHHIAMMQGVTEGVRALLQSLSPQANDIDAGNRLFGGGKAKGQWKAYLEHFDQVITDDNELHAAIFGNDFARAYASVTVGGGGKPSKEDDE